MFNIEARAKWGAWNKLGDMAPHEARLAYLSLLSSLAPEWKSWKGLAAAFSSQAEQPVKTEPPAQPQSSDPKEEEDFDRAVTYVRSVQTRHLSENNVQDDQHQSRTTSARCFLT
jgi:hypothetical protein